MGGSDNNVNEVSGAKAYVTAGWSDVPHLDQKTKEELWKSTPPHLREARANGTPSLGAGAVYPINPDSFRIPPFEIPAYFTRGYGFDPGWKRTAAIWGAYDRDNDVIYLTGEHYMGEQPITVHAAAIKARGAWMPGMADYAGVNTLDGKRVIEEYRKLELRLQFADKAVEAGIMEVYDRLVSGRLKVFSTLSHWFDEYRYYIRDEKNGQIVKKNDHLMDATRYLVMGHKSMIVRPVALDPWQARNGTAPIDRKGGY